MPSTYTQNLGLEKPGTGEQAGTWGNTVNAGYDYLDTSTDGNLHIPISGGAYNLDTAQAAPSEGRNKVIIWTGTMAGNVSVNITPNTAKKMYVMTHAASGNFNITFTQGEGGSFTLQPGYSAIIYCDGGGPGARVDGALYNVQLGNAVVNGNLAVSGAFSVAQPSTFTQPVTFNNSVTLDSGWPVVAANFIINQPGFSQAPYDIYYRHPNGPVVSLPIGGAGQLLQVQPGPSLAWATVQTKVGDFIPGSVAWAIYLASPSGTLMQDSEVRINPGAGIGIGVTPAHSLHLGYSRTPEIWLDTNDPANVQRQFIFATNNTPRWYFYTQGAAETGGNAGSNLGLLACNDAGAGITWAMTWWRSNGNVTVGTYGDQGAKLAVFGTDPAQVPILVRGAGGQQNLQMWQNSAGQTVAWIDGTGRLNSAGGSNFLSLDGEGRLDLHGTVAGHPLGSIHIGAEPVISTLRLRPSIVLEAAQNIVDPMPPNAVRMFFRNGNFILQYFFNGNQYYAYLPLGPQAWGPAQWFISIGSV